MASLLKLKINAKAAEINIKLKTLLTIMETFKKD
jgi:hypothetical protein